MLHFSEPVKIVAEVSEVQKPLTPEPMKSATPEPEPPSEDVYATVQKPKYPIPESEFATMFNKLKKQSSSKSLQLENEDEQDKPSISIKFSDDKPESAEVKKPKPLTVKPVITAAKPTELNNTQTRTVSTEQLPATSAVKTDTQPAETSKPDTIVIEKNTSVVNSSLDKPAVIDKKPVLSEKTVEKKVSVPEKNVEDKKPDSDKKSTTTENSKENQENPIKSPVLRRVESKKPVATETNNSDGQRDLIIDGKEVG